MREPNKKFQFRWRVTHLSTREKLNDRETLETTENKALPPISGVDVKPQRKSPDEKMNFIGALRLPRVDRPPDQPLPASGADGITVIVCTNPSCGSGWINIAEH